MNIIKELFQKWSMYFLSERQTRVMIFFISPPPNISSFIKSISACFKGNGLLDRMMIFFFPVGAIIADTIIYNTIPNHSHLDASANYIFTHCMFENVVNYLCPLFSLSAPILFPKANRKDLNCLLYIKNERTCNSYSAVRSAIHH